MRVQEIEQTTKQFHHPLQPPTNDSLSRLGDSITSRLFLRPRIVIERLTPPARQTRDSRDLLTDAELFDNWREKEFHCQKCKWHGPGSALSLGNYTLDYAERLCPVCEECITVVLHPTIAESRANWDNVSEWDRKNIEAAEACQAEFARRKLSEPSQLPDIVEPSFVLHWDFADDGARRETLIKHGDVVIFAKPAFYEGYERYIEVAEILHSRYGAALRDMIPTKVSELYLYGDESASRALVAAARERVSARL